jgi:threonine dehydratase
MSEARRDSPANPLRGHRIALSAVQAARQVIDPVFLNSPCYECEPLSMALGCRLILKLETANPIRSFKGRGASLLVRGLKPDGNSAPLAALVSASAGNWGQALAYACRDAGMPLIVYAATSANALKVARMRSLGAEVRLAGNDFDAAKKEAEGFAQEAGLRMVADGLDVEASVGAATIGIELAARGNYDAILAPLGNGALLTGIGRWTKAVSQATEVIGVSATGADAMAASWRSGHLVTRDRAETIADGIAVRVPIPEAVADMNGTVDDLLLVPDDAIVAAMRLLFSEAGLMVEPAGAAGVAAVLIYPERFQGKRVATVLCGGNVTGEQVRRWMT